MEREFDVIVFGASGFTGKFVVEEMAKNVSQLNIRWAAAGRNRHKIQQILTEVQNRLSDDLKDIEIFEADVRDQTSLEILCEKTKLVINCVGPYTTYAEPVIVACLKSGTHIVDMAMEVPHVSNMMLKYYHEAESRGVYIIRACALQYLFYEMVVPILQEKLNGGIDRIDVHIKPEIKRRCIHFATWKSYVNMSNSIYEILVAKQRVYSEIIKKTRSKWSILSLAWPMKCSRGIKGLSFYYPAILHTTEISLDMREVSFDEKPVKITYYLAIDSVVMLLLSAIAIFFLIFLYPFSCGRRLLIKYAGLFSCGLVKKSTLSEETEDVATMNFTAVAKGWSQKQQNNQQHVTEAPNKTVILLGSGPTAYKNSAVCLVQAALTVLEETDRLPNRGGIFTPLAAFSKTSLPSRLQKSGITYEEKGKEIIL